MPYPYLPPESTYESLRVSLPNSIYDPELGYQLYAKYFDIFQAADALGLDMMLNEHHSTATCVEPAVPVTMAILARTTSRGRILALGNPIANRNTPVRVAEEMAMIDVISHGRAEVGFVRGVPYEVSAGNVNPVDMQERFWEGAELIVKAWTTTDGPFNWEGRYYHHRQVNIWPRPFQEPHPPVWVPTQSTGTVREVAARRYKLGTILCGWQGARRMFDVYRDRSAELGLPAPDLDMFGYLGMVFVGDTHKEGIAGARKLQWYLQHNKVATQFMDVPGYIDEGTRARLFRSQADGKPVTTPIAHLTHAPIEELTKDGYFFAGSPDTVFEQMERFYERVGGFGNFLMMVQAGTMGYDLVERSMARFANEVLPRFRAEVYGRELDPDRPAGP
jgi:alkanesulfonate monooxygenase SsuD/methylene tetrahydromethanopterin reductase-like flavin-dependent oxidoreductase (luciferase family)